jgi:hypothetical protein
MLSKIDNQQWKYEEHGDRHIFRARLSQHSWIISKQCVGRFLQALDVAAVNSVLSVSLVEPHCVCIAVGKPNCQNLFTREQVLSQRGQWWEQYPNSVGWIVNILKAHNSDIIAKYVHNQGEKRVNINYFISSICVCRTFFRFFYGLSKHKVDEISRLVVGNTKQTTSKMNFKVVPYRKDATPSQIANSFWTDFFSTCQSPVEGLRLFPVNQSRLCIYCNFFYPWFEVVHLGRTLENVVDVPVGVDRQLVQEIEWEEETKHTTFAEQKSFDCNSPDFLELLVSSLCGQVPKETASQVVVHDVVVVPEKDKEQTEEEEVLSESEELIENTLKCMKFPKAFPSFATFCRVRWYPQHADVKARAKHNHCRCRDCALIESKMMKAFQSASDRSEWEKMSKEHNSEVRRWRSFENDMQSVARHTPDSVIVLSYDDTSSFGLPHFTKRSIKNMTNNTVNIIPFGLTNHGTGENVYIYTVKGRYSKGANRTCTSLYHTIKRIKEKDPLVCLPNELRQRNARKLVLMADNASDNKNNSIFAFCCELIWTGWFDTVEMYFGPVGHTHNGNDGDHFVHNQIAGNKDSVTLAEFFKGFYNSWAKDTTRPEPLILDTQYNWEQHYREHIQEVSYYSRSHTNESYVRAFRFHRARDSRIEMMCKGSTSAKIGVD